MGSRLTTDIVFDGYRLNRFLGRGGFGEVWLCRSEAMGDYHAIKFVAGTRPDLLEKEHQALALYRREAARLRSPHLVPIEHINRDESSLYYVMPLADGVTAGDPADPAWQPLSLAAIIHARITETTWFSNKEIAALFLPILHALQTLSDARLVHRDVKPENILFFNGLPCLGDISLLGVDAAAITRRGTPGYSTPSWYAGGHPDMYGAAATLYTLLTGSLPDKMGRSAFLWPQQGEFSLAETERAEWKRLHGVIRRATDEKVAERFVDFAAMAEAVAAIGPAPALPPPPVRSTAKMSLIPAIAVLGLILLAVGGVVIGGLRTERGADEANPAPSTSELTGKPSATENTQGVGKHAEALSQPKLDRSPRDPENGPFSLQDSKLAYNSLAWFLESEYPLSAEARDVLENALINIRMYTQNQHAQDFKAAVRSVDECSQAIPTLHKSQNVKLAKLLLLLCDGERIQVDHELHDPSLLVLGDDNLSYRVEMMSRLGGDYLGRQLLDETIASPDTKPIEKSLALMERARLQASFSGYEGARLDSEMALELIAGNPAELSRRQLELDEIKRDYPGFARFLKTSQKK